jgi:hypothetical protein
MAQKIEQMPERGSVPSARPHLPSAVLQILLQMIGGDGP